MKDYTGGSGKTVELANASWTEASVRQNIVDKCAAGAGTRQLLPFCGSEEEALTQALTFRLIV